MLLKNFMPSSQIISIAERRNKDYNIEFINANSSNDIYHLKTFLRKDECNKKYKVRVQIVSNILAYPALNMIWTFKDSEYDFASRVYHRICDEVDEIKENFDRSMAPITIISKIVKESLKPISVNYQESTFIVPLDESIKLKGEPDARMTIYHGHYPNMTKEEKQKIQKFEGNEQDKPLTKKKYKTREKY